MRYACWVTTPHTTYTYWQEYSWKNKLIFHNALLNSKAQNSEIQFQRSFRLHQLFIRQIGGGEEKESA